MFHATYDPMIDQIDLEAAVGGPLALMKWRHTSHNVEVRS